MEKQILMLGAGCFWGVELKFSQIKGVLSTFVGYAGGQTENPTYEEVCRKNTGHAEVVLIEFDATQITREALLMHFFTMHNPTTLNRQGPDVGKQYRSVIFVANEQETQLVEAVMQKSQQHYSDKIVTTLEPLSPFWKAEDYHQQYFKKRGIT